MSKPDREALIRLASSLPDIPRWIEPRSLLFSGDCEIFGLTAGSTGFVVRDPEDVGVSVVGQPSVGAIREATAREREDESVFSPPETRNLVSEALPGWEPGSATFHLMDELSKLLDAQTEPAKIVSASDVDLDALPDDLRPWLEMTFARGTPVAAAFSEGRAVSFCCAVSTSETLWDISVDTIPGQRNRGHAARCVAAMARHMLPLRPVWAADESNVASMRLAAKLGFVPVDRLDVFSRPLYR